jgi:hypothetical protein
LTVSEVASTIIEQIEGLFNVTINGQKISFFRMVGALDKNNLNMGKLLCSDNSVLFAVQTPKLNGKVEVVYNEGSDLYDIRLYNKKDLVECKPTKEINEVFFDQLTKILVEELGI